MNKGEEKKIHEILESGSIGYAYLFDAKARKTLEKVCLLYTSDAADDLHCVDLGGRQILKKKKLLCIRCSAHTVTKTTNAKYELSR